MVGVVTGYFASSGNGEDTNFVVSVAVKINKAFKRGDKSFALRLDVCIQIGILGECSALYNFFKF